MRNNRAYADDERTDEQYADSRGGGGGDERKDQQQEVDEQDSAAAVEVGERNEENQSEGVSALGIEGDVVGGECRDTEFLPDHVEQRLVVVKVGYGDSGNGGQRIEQAAGESCTLFEQRFHAARILTDKCTDKRQKFLYVVKNSSGGFSRQCFLC